MKKPILFPILIAVAVIVQAQNPRIETLGERQTQTFTYEKGGDSLRYIILGKNDTVQETAFYRSGKVMYVSWKKDSSYCYDALGNLESKRFNFEHKYFLGSNYATFYENGQINEFQSLKNNLRTTKNFTEDGRLLMIKEQNYTPKGSYTRQTDRKGILMQTYRRDTVAFGENPKIRSYDTVYYEDGRVFKTTIDEGRSVINAYFYDKQGVLTKSSPPDSSRLTVFKDNIDCFYGLKNKNGDTVVKPRFDNIDCFYDAFIMAYLGKSLILLKPNGESMTPFTQNLQDINLLAPTYYEEETEEKRKNKDISERSSLVGGDNFFSFFDGDKYGVINDKFEQVMPPQKFSIGNGYVGNGVFFEFEERQNDSLVQKSYLNRQGKRIFPEQFKSVDYTYYEDYFFLNDKAITNDYDLRQKGYSMWIHGEDKELFPLAVANTKALGKGDGTVLIPPKFYDISQVYKTPLFIAAHIVPNIQAQTGRYNYGIYNAHTRKWLLDTIGYAVRNKSNPKLAFFIVEQFSTGKEGLMDTMGKYILPLSYDYIGSDAYVEDLFYVKKNNKYQIFESKAGKPNLHKTKYEFLDFINFKYWRNDIDKFVYYFLAKRNGKWGVIDRHENIIKPFEYDYASTNESYEGRFYLVKNNYATSYDIYSLPNQSKEKPAYTVFSRHSLADKKLRVFFTNDTGKVVIPPDYELHLGIPNGYYVLVKDSQKHKKIIFYESSRVVDYPFDYDIKIAENESRVIVVKDSLPNTYGVVSTDGKVIMPLINYGIALADVNASVFFAKRDTPLVLRSEYDNFEKQIDSDTLNEEDNGWLMYDGDGKLLNAKPFAFPVAFKKDVGIGMQEGEFNLYKNNGTILKPFVKGKIGVYTEGSLGSIKNIRRDRETGFYSLFFNQGLSSTMILTKSNGEILVESGHYDGISRFYGKYALVTAKNLVGLIDTFGNEVIAPKDLRIYTGQFMDSLDLYYKSPKEEELEERLLAPASRNALPISFENSNNLHPDSLKINDWQRAALWNLLLEKRQSSSIKTVSDVKFSRATLQAKAHFFRETNISFNFDSSYPNKITVADSTIAFALGTVSQSRGNDLIFYNFYHRNNRWEELKINDLLNIQGENRWKMNDLITKKVRALKNAEIDCSNIFAFITIVENRFMLTKEGIDFCFDSTKYGSDMVVISFTWAELSPFLKIKIY